MGREAGEVLAEGSALNGGSRLMQETCALTGQRVCARVRVRVARLHKLGTAWRN